VTSQKRWALGLAVLVCVAALVLVWVRGDARSGISPTTSSADAADATVVSAAVKNEAREAAAAGAAAAYSYSWKTLADDKEAARALMTPAMQDRYDRTMAGVATSSRRERSVVSAEVVDTALVTASSRDARVLVFVNQSTTGDDLDEPTLDLDRVLVTLHRVEEDWKVSELDAL
jgi:Mce-associated membrane protein